MNTARFPELLRAIYDAVDELEAMFPGRHFTPDGHLVGSLGEALAAHHYGIHLSPASSAKHHDGTCNGRNVQVKATQGTRIALSSEPEHLLVLRLNRDRTFEEKYNGPGRKVWELVSYKARPSNGQHQISLATLGCLMQQVDLNNRLAKTAGS